MAEELTVLAEAGAAAVVAAMATELWQNTRDAVLGLFGRADPDGRALAEARLDNDAATVREAAHPDDARRALADFWTGELAALVRRDPSCAELLTRLACGAGGALQAGPAGDVLEQTNTAHGSGTVFAVQRGVLNAYRPDPGR